MEPSTQTSNYDDPQVAAQAANLTKAIFQHESGMDYNAVGDAGTSHGAGQWQPATWKAQAQDVLGDANAPMTQANQSVVAQGTIRKLIKSGKNAAQIAAIWNSGSDENWENKVGTTSINGQQVKYNVPQYVKSVTDLYQQYRGGDNSSPTQGYQPPAQAGQQPLSSAPVQGYAPPQAPQQTQAPAVAQPSTDPSGGFLSGLQEDLQGTNPESAGTQLENTAKGLGNFLFPIVGDVKNDLTGQNNKSALQQVGDAGLSALGFIPGLGEGADAARLGIEGGADAVKGAGLVGKLTGTIGKNAVVGYGAGTASNLSNGQSIGQALTPQASNIGGAFLGGSAAGILGKLAQKSGDQAVIDKLEKVYGDAFGATKTGIKASSKIVGRGADAPETFLAHAGIAPETDEVNGRTVFKTGEDSATYRAIQSRASALTDLRDKLIDSADTSDLGDGMSMEHTGSSLSDLKNEAIAQANKTFMGKERAVAVNHLNDEFDALSQQFGTNDVSLKQLNSVKKYFQGNTNFDQTRPSTITSANKLAAGVTKTAVETDAEKAGIPGIGGLNNMIRQHLDFLNTEGKKGLLDKLNGQTVKGGRLGTYVREGIGAGIGGTAGKVLGGGPIGEIGGILAGGVVGHHLAKIEQLLSVGGPRMAARLGKIAQEDPQAVQELLAIIKEKGIQAQEGLVAPSLVPKNKPTGLVGNLITKGAARAGAAL